ncbi:GNAT family N-acetyltransferase [Crocinitomix catalasitica]|nr:GNAT family N-acetyltransferase [Crocinitomix catalasitica]
MTGNFTIRDAHPSEFPEVGQLMVSVYSNLEGFPSPEEQPAYYNLLANIGDLTQNLKTRLLIAVSGNGKIGGGVVYFGDMKYYGSGGTAPQEKNAAGFRLLAVNPETRGSGIGRLLSEACIQTAKDDGLPQLIIHTTEAMKLAWGMYERMGFKRSEDLDFLQDGFPVFGFRLTF